MKNFVLYSSLEVPHKISKEEFEKYTNPLIHKYFDELKKYLEEV